MTIKRLERLDVATSDLSDAVSIYQKNFDFKVRRVTNSDDAMIELGDVHIRLRTGTPVADFIASSGEGLAALWLEADDVHQVANTLGSAGVELSPIRVEANRLILAVHPASASMVPLFIFELL